MEDTTLLQLVTGPTSSLILLLAGLGAAWRFFHQTIVPTAKAAVESHLEHVDKIIDEHAQDRAAWLESMRECKDQHRETIRKLDEIADRLPARR